MSRFMRLAPLTLIAAFAATLLTASQAFATIAFSPVPSTSQHGRIADWTWDNGDPAIGGGSNGNISTIMSSDTLDSMCFGSWTSGAQVGVFYSQLASGGTGWSAAKRLSGAYDADRGTLATSGSNVDVAWSSQTKYYSLTKAGACGKAYNFDATAPRLDYFRRSTDNGSTWGKAYKLPGQSPTFRGDYMYIAANGSNIYIATTNADTGAILLWISTNGGVSFNNPLTVATTKYQDTLVGQSNGSCPCGYVDGFSGLPAIATDGSAIGIAYNATATGAEKIIICSTSGTGCSSPTTVASSGANANSGYSQAAGDSSSGRMVFTWTTAGAAFSDVWTGGTGGSFGGVKTITTFPDANFASTSCPSTNRCNQEGSGAIPVLLGSSGIGISLTECNLVSGSYCDESQTLAKSREVLVWYESSNNGGTYGSHALIQQPTTGSSSTAAETFMSEFGSIANIGGSPYVLFTGHDDQYFSGYAVFVRKCSGC